MRSIGGTVPGVFYHFTCDHGHAGISVSGVVRPNHHPVIGLALSWWTDLASPGRDDVGLTSESGLISCDRMAFRYRAVDSQFLHPWLGSPEQARTPTHWQVGLHAFSRPGHWWVARRPVPIELAP